MWGGLGGLSLVSLELGMSVGVVKQWVRLVLGTFLPCSQLHEILVLEVRVQVDPDGIDGSLG